MKIWYGVGSEHSSNLVMIARFKDVKIAKKAKEILDKIMGQQAKENSPNVFDQSADRFSEDMLALLSKLHVSTIRPHELEQFAYDSSITIDGAEIVVRTEESEISAFTKVFLAMNGRMEIYSAHDYPDKE